jgi:hypothetical protein
MIDQNQTEIEVEAGDYITRDNVKKLNNHADGERYRQLTKKPRNADNVASYILEDTETGAYIIVTHKINLTNADYYVSSVDVEFRYDGKKVDFPLDDINAADGNTGGVYAHSITKSRLQIEYMPGDKGLTEEMIDTAPDNWDLEVEVVEK